MILFLFQLVRVVRLSSSVCQVTQVRWKKVPKWRDPQDFSWAQPLLERHKRKEEEAGKVEQAPSMLHMVTRVRPLYGRPHWEKKAMKNLGLAEKVFLFCLQWQTQIVVFESNNKNLSPEGNFILWGSGDYR